MIGYTFSDINHITGGRLLAQKGNPVIEYLLTDSRKLLFPESTLFFAISSAYKEAVPFVFELFYP